MRNRPRGGGRAGPAALRFGTAGATTGGREMRFLRRTPTVEVALPDLAQRRGGEILGARGGPSRAGGGDRAALAAPQRGGGVPLVPRCDRAGAAVRPGAHARPLQRGGGAARGGGLAH